MGARTCFYPTRLHVELFKLRSMKVLNIVLFLLLSAFTSVHAQSIPLVYDKENTGSHFPTPILPELSQLPDVNLLPNPFMWSDGSGYIAGFKDWSRRRAEIGQEIQHYEIGEKPAVARENLKAKLKNGPSRQIS